MANVTIDRIAQHVHKLFKILLASPDGCPAQKALQELRDTSQLTEYELGQYSSGVPRFERLVRFETIVCVKAGWLIKQRGNWSVSELGQLAYKKYPKPEEFYREAIRLYREWDKRRKGTSDTLEVDVVHEEDGLENSATVTFESADDQAWTEIEAYLETIDPFEFQRLVASLLTAMGYHVNWISPPGKDGGVDIIAFNDPLGTTLPRIKVQVKRHAKEKIDSDGIKSFIAMIGEHDVGIYINLGGFTRDAERFAREQERRRVTLIDLEKLVEYWVAAYSKLSEDARALLPLKPIYFLTPKA